MNPPAVDRMLLGVRREEWPLAILLAASFFLVISSFWILKPLKKALFLLHYDAEGLAIGPLLWNAAQAELLVKVLNLVVAAVAFAALSALATRFRRERLMLVVSGFFFVGYVGFAVVLRAPEPASLAVWSFYLFGDLLASVMVAAFFSFVNDSLRPEAAKRLLGPIGLGGVLGGLVGSSVLRLLLDRLSTADWLVVTAGLAVGIALLAIAAGRRVAAIDARAEHPAADATATNAEAEREVVHAEERGRPVEIERGGSPALAGARLVLASPYLLAIATTVGVYEIVSTVVDFQFTTTVHTTLDGPALGRHLARVYLLTNVASVAVQAFLTSLVMRRFGVGAALAVLPVALGLASVGFLFVPTLAFASLLSLADNSLAYSIAQSSKEMLYVPTTTAERYQAKAFIDVFVQRLAKVLAIGVSLALTTWTGADQVRWLGLLSIPLVGVSLLAVSRAGCDFRVREHEIEGPCPNPLAEVRRWIGRRVLRPATRRVGGLRTGDA